MAILSQLPRNNQYAESSFGIPSLFRVPEEQKLKAVPENNIPSNIWLIDVEVSNWGTVAQKFKTIRKLRIQTVPLELSVDPQTAWATIPVLGRNLPHYHYTGSEKVVQFTLDWYSNNPNKRDVIEKCRWVESLTVNDGWEKPPSIVLLIWGDLYKGSTFIVERAPYRLSLFDKEHGMMPRQAYQEITLKQVSGNNPTRLDITNPNLMTPADGIFDMDNISPTKYNSTGGYS